MVLSELQHDSAQSDAIMMGYNMNHCGLVIQSILIKMVCLLSYGKS